MKMSTILTLAGLGLTAVAGISELRENGKEAAAEKKERSDAFNNELTSFREAGNKEIASFREAGNKEIADWRNSAESAKADWITSSKQAWEATLSPEQKKRLQENLKFT